MVATMAVLGIMGVFIVQTIDVVNKTTSRSEGMLDSSSEARLVLDRIGKDLTGMFVRRDMDYIFENPTVSADDIMRFYSEVFTETSIDSTMVRFSLVGYRVDDDGTGTDAKLALFRGAKGYTYLDNNIMGLDFVSTTDSITGLVTETINVISIDKDPTTGANRLNDSDYDLLSPNVFRMEIAIIDGSGALKSKIPTDSLHGGAASADIEDAKYLIVGIAILSPDDRARLTKAQIKSLADALPRVVNGQTPFDAWDKYIEGSTALPGPSGIVSNVRFFQRAYPLSDR